MYLCKRKTEHIMLKSMIIVGIGSFLGGSLRYVTSTMMKNVCGQDLPWGTLTVNLLGCLVFGLIFALFSKYATTSSPWYLLFTTGICGGFTTFSTFANESMQMLQSGNIGGFIGYVSTSVIGGIALIGLGYWIIK
jgi:CrcB protein